MKIIISFSIFLSLTLFDFLQSSQPAQYSLIPTFQWTSQKKNNQNQEITPDQDFSNLTNIKAIITDIIQEKPATCYWVFSSTNLPNYKLLKIQKTNDVTKITDLITYKMLIPADNNNHLNTSIWGFHPVFSKTSLIGLSPHTATEISEIFAHANTATSRILMPIIHCITTATFQYSPQPSHNSSENVGQTDNKFQYDLEQKSHGK